jgi:hypothetical protein
MKRVLSASIAALCLVANAQETKFNIGDCYGALWADPQASPVTKRLGLGQKPVPLELRASKAKANAKEKTALEFVAAGMQNCQKLDQVNRADFHPALRHAVDEFENAMRSALTKTYSGDLSWGGLIEANESNAVALDRKVAEIQTLLQAQAREEQEKKAAQSIADAKAEEVRRAALRADYERMQALQAQQEQAKRANDQQQLMNSLMLLDAARPKPAPMMPFNNNISCTSQNLNGTVHTNCR